MTDIDGDFIRKLRWELGWSQRELAKKLGVTPGSVGQWESSMTKPGRKNQERLKDLASKAKQSPFSIFIEISLTATLFFCPET